MAPMLRYSSAKEAAMVQFAKRAILGTLAASLVSVTAIAAEDQGQKPAGDIHVGQGVVCDTAAQVERFTTLMDESSDMEKAITAVNTEAENPRACGMVLAAFVRGEEVGEVRKDNRAMKVVEITILAVPVGDKWHFVTPLKQYTAIAPKGIEI
jgi:hypothetical protein